MNQLPTQTATDQVQEYILSTDANMSDVGSIILPSLDQIEVCRSKIHQCRWLERWIADNKRSVSTIQILSQEGFLRTQSRVQAT